MHMPSWPKIPLWPKQISNEEKIANTLAILDELDNPHHKLPPTIHVAGTNGKGSTVAMLRAVFMAAGLKVDIYTSPHLIEFNERIQLNGKNISDEYILSLLDQVKYACDKLSIEPGLFQATTIAAFLAFSENKSDIVILETGLGGLYDTTNIISHPIATIITPISYDHMEHLGNTLESITYNKAGIIKPNCPAIISAQTDIAHKILAKRCRELQSPAAFYEYDFGIKIHDTSFSYVSSNHKIDLPLPNLPGHHQLVNAATVIATILMLNQKFNVTQDHIVKGLTNIKWPGRIEKVDSLLMQSGIKANIYLDGAHNVAGAKSLSLWIQDKLKGPVYLIVGMTRGRDIEAFCSEFSNITEEIRCVTVLSEPSAYNATTMVDKLQSAGIKSIASKSLEDAIKSITSNHHDCDINIIITGSLFLIGDFKRSNI